MEPTTEHEDDTREAVQAILAGQVNLAEAMQAIRQVIQSSDAVLEWEIDCSKIQVMADHGIDATFSQDDLTLGEQIRIVDDTGIGWGDFSPQNDQRHAAAVLAAYLAGRAGISHDAAKELIEGVTTGEFDNAHTIVEKRPAPPT